MPESSSVSASFFNFLILGVINMGEETQIPGPISDQ